MKLSFLRSDFEDACESYRNVVLAMQRLLKETNDERVQRIARREFRFFSHWMHACSERVWYCRTGADGACARTQDECITSDDGAEPCSEQTEVYTFSTEAKNSAFRDLDACEATRALTAKTEGVSMCDPIGEDAVP